MTAGRRCPVGSPRADLEDDDDVVEVTLTFDAPLSKDALRERCEAIADRLEE